MSHCCGSSSHLENISRPCQNKSTHVWRLKLTPPSLDSMFPFASSQETNLNWQRRIEFDLHTWLPFGQTGLVLLRVWSTGAQSSSQITERGEQDPVGTHLGSALSQRLPSSFSRPRECSTQGHGAFYSWEKREQEKLHVCSVGAETKWVRSSKQARAL